MVAPHTGPNGHHDHPKLSASPPPAEALREPAKGPHPLEPLMAHLTELRRHAGHYVQATADSFRLSVRQVILKAVLAGLGAVVGITALITAAVFLLVGAAGGIGEALGGRAWAGQLIVGLTVLLVTAAACWWGMRKANEASRRKTREKYERQHFQEQVHVDSDAAQPVQRG